MQIGLCPRCSHPYSTQDVVTYGVLKPRPARAGGPLVEYRCEQCKRIITLVPHGHGRYARPGEPPPPEAAPEERRPPWGGQPPQPENAPPTHEIPTPEEPEQNAAPSEPPRELPPTRVEALTVLDLDVSATAEDVEEAYRRLSLRCHPDKVAHLDEDFQALATQKFRRLGAARDVLLAALRATEGSPD